MRITTTSLWIFVMLTAGVRDAWHAVLTAQMPAARAPMPIDVAFAEGDRAYRPARAFE